MEGKLILLGTGASAGVPVIGCACSVCKSQDSRNKRLRTSASLKISGREYLIDCSPDYRQQALTNNLSCPEALFLTHTHYDHIGGLEELRAYSITRKDPIRCYLSKKSFESVRKLYFYHFFPENPEASFTAKFDFQVLEEDAGEIFVDEMRVSYFTYYQGEMPVTGFRFGSLAYVTDIKTYDNSLFSYLTNLDWLLLSVLRRGPSRMQMTLEEALSFSEKVASQQTFFMHISHEIDHENEAQKLPQNIHLAYDGMEIDFHDRSKK